MGEANSMNDITIKISLFFGQILIMIILGLITFIINRQNKINDQNFQTLFEALKLLMPKEMCAQQHSAHQQIHNLEREGDLHEKKHLVDDLNGFGRRVSNVEKRVGA